MICDWSNMYACKTLQSTLQQQVWLKYWTVQRLQLDILQDSYSVTPPNYRLSEDQNLFLTTFL